MVSISNYAEAGPRSVAVVSLEQHSTVALAVRRNDYVCSSHKSWCAQAGSCWGHRRGCMHCRLQATWGGSSVGQMGRLLGMACLQEQAPVAAPVVRGAVSSSSHYFEMFAASYPALCISACLRIAIRPRQRGSSCAYVLNMYQCTNAAW